MKKFNQLVEQVMASADLLLVVLDARNIEASLHPELQRMLEGKKHIYVINKGDLLKKGDRPKLPKNAMLVSAQKRMGTLLLWRRIKRMSNGKPMTVGVVGFPNTGKSTLINTLKGRHSAPTSSMSGYTRSLRSVRLDKDIVIIDTPGVLSYSQKVDANAITLGTVDQEKLTDPEDVACQLIDKMRGQVEEYFGVEPGDDAEATLAAIAAKKHIVAPGNRPDTVRMAKIIIRLLQKGKIPGP